MTATERTMEQSLAHPTEDELLVGRVYLAMKAFNDAVLEVAQRGILTEIRPSFYGPASFAKPGDAVPEKRGAEQIFIRCYRRQEVLGIWHTGESFGLHTVEVIGGGEHRAENA